MALTTAGVFLDFTWFREQTCLVACPYGRFQSVLLDRQSLIVAYDFNRGEPRMKGKARPTGAGDCIDCGACVLTCPTGIDIRDGLQMECIHCTQCADACDDVMTRIGKPRGLIRYSSREILEGHARRLLRPRVILYPLALLLLLGGFGYTLATRAAADVTILRGREAFTRADDGRIANQVRITIANRTDEPHEYRIEVANAEMGTVIAPQNPLAVGAGASEVTTLFILLPRSAFDDGERRVTVRVGDGAGFRTELPYRLVGPRDHDEHDEHDEHDDARGARAPRGGNGSGS
jgi:cytochrome c oxidase accessory protein FixG